MKYDFNDDVIIQNLDYKLADILNYVEVLIEPFDDIATDIDVGGNYGSIQNTTNYSVCLRIEKNDGNTDITLVYNTKGKVINVLLTGYDFKNNCIDGDFIGSYWNSSEYSNSGARKNRHRDRNPTLTHKRPYINPRMFTTESIKESPMETIKLPVYRDIYNFLIVGWKTPTNKVPLGLKQTLNQQFNGEHLENFVI